MARAIVVDSKVQYPAARNAVETVLVHVDDAPAVLPELMTELYRYGVELRGCLRTLELVRRLGLPGRVVPATEDDWRTEYGALVLACRIVDDIDSALHHIDEYGSHHTEAIVTADESAAHRFLTVVDAASVFHNASTRFADGYRYGLGAEVGISTGKLHARGPVGLDGLTTTRWILRGGGQVVASYVGPDARAFRHEQGRLDRTERTRPAEGLPPLA